MWNNELLLGIFIQHIDINQYNTFSIINKCCNKVSKDSFRLFLQSRHRNFNGYSTMNKWLIRCTLYNKVNIFNDILKRCVILTRAIEICIQLCIQFGRVNILDILFNTYKDFQVDILCKELHMSAYSEECIPLYYYLTTKIKSISSHLLRDMVIDIFKSSFYYKKINLAKLIVLEHPSLIDEGVILSTFDKDCIFEYDMLVYLYQLMKINKIEKEQISRSLHIKIGQFMYLNHIRGIKFVMNSLNGFNLLTRKQLRDMVKDNFFINKDTYECIIKLSKRCSQN